MGFLLLVSLVQWLQNLPHLYNHRHYLSCICFSLAMLEVNLEGVQEGGQEAPHCS